MTVWTNPVLLFTTAAAGIWGAILGADIVSGAGGGVLVLDVVFLTVFAIMANAEYRQATRGGDTGEVGQ